MVDKDIGACIYIYMERERSIGYVYICIYVYRYTYAHSYIYSYIHIHTAIYLCCSTCIDELTSCAAAHVFQITMNLQVLLDNDALHIWSPFSLPSSSLYVSGSCCLTTVVTIPTWRIYIYLYICVHIGTDTSVGIIHIYACRRVSVSCSSRCAAESYQITVQSQGEKMTACTLLPLCIGGNSRKIQAASFLSF